MTLLVSVTALPDRLALSAFLEPSFTVIVRVFWVRVLKRLS
ncbi:Uncharacterised protein [Kytococcus sedentarius]|nr:Uncharacterised protein [Kytococcus sedentarius]